MYQKLVLLDTMVTQDWRFFADLDLWSDYVQDAEKRQEQIARMLKGPPEPQLEADEDEDEPDDEADEGPEIHERKNGIPETVLLDAQQLRDTGLSWKGIQQCS